MTWAMLFWMVCANWAKVMGTVMGVISSERSASINEAQSSAEGRRGQQSGHDDLSGRMADPAI